MKTFIEEVADHLLEHHQDHLKDTILVLPGKRSGLFLKRTLKQKGYTGWLPSIQTLSDVLQSMTGLQAGDTLDLIFELYLTWRKHFNPEESFNSFLEWGPALLNDFNEIDHYLADAHRVYRNLKAYKDIENWSFGEDEDQWSENQKRFSDFWGKLGRTYELFQENAKSNGVFLGGTIARKAAEDPILGFEKTRSKHLVVAGLNALSNAEQKVLRKLEETGKATMLWDADQHYASLSEQLEAGKFLREWQQRTKPISFPDHLRSKKKEIHFVGCNSSITQMQYVHRVLSDKQGDDETSTAVILPDNSVLPALLPSIPESYQHMNVTMGKALSHTPYKSLLHRFFRLLDLRSKSIRHTQLLPFLRHTLLSAPGAPFEKEIKSITTLVVKENLVFLGVKDLRGLLEKVKDDSGVLAKFFEEVFEVLTERNAAATLKPLSTLLQLIQPMGDNKEAFHTWRIFGDLIQRIKRMYARYPLLETPRDLERILGKLFNRLQVDLIGEPLIGLQIMGLLESRSLDFKKVILLSCNEGILPKQSFNESLLPYEIRSYYQLPSRADRDAIFAYYFYRLIQRAEEVHLCYDAGESTHKSGEKSRFLQQLEMSDMLREPMVQRISKQIIPQTPNDPPEIPAIGASEWSDKRLKELLENGLSPSALNKWFQCPSEFFYKYILGLREQDAVEEEMEHNTFGSILHEVLENGYKPLKGKMLTMQDMEDLKAKIEAYLDSAIEENYSMRLMRSGANYLYRSVAERFLQKLLQLEISELQETEILLQEVEESFEQPLAEGIMIKGKADRVDRSNGQLRIIDYKSGKVDGNKELQINKDFWENLHKKDKAVQTVLYSWMAYKKYGQPTTAGIISARNYKSGFQPVGKEKNVFTMDQDVAIEFESWLKERISEMSLSVTPAVHQGKYCEYCVSLED